MQVIDYLKENGFDKLEEELSIIIKRYDEGLFVLNYDQLSSTKTNPIVMECRGIILDKDYNIVCRPFDRFFNYGEAGATFNPDEATLYEKIDGSLIKIYYWGGEWRIATRGTAFAESSVGVWDITFKDMVLRALKCDYNAFQQRCEEYLDKEYTYLCEVTGVENRIVTRYKGYSLWFLAARHTKLGTYFAQDTEVLESFGFKLPKAYRFSTVQECLEVVSELPDLKEGYIAYENGVPVCKIKSPKYVAVYHIRGEGLTPNSVAELVCVNEWEEYLTYYPEDKGHIMPYIEAFEGLINSATDLYESNKHIDDQKEFALKVKEHPLYSCIFMARSLDKSVLECLNSQRLNYKIKILRKEVEG